MQALSRSAGIFAGSAALGVGALAAVSAPTIIPWFYANAANITTGTAIVGEAIAPGSGEGTLLAQSAKAAQLAANRIAGGLFRDQLAASLRAAGRGAVTEVYKWTPFGKRFIDIEVSIGGRVLGGIETKVGSSQYTWTQQLKDWWLATTQGYPVNVARDR